MTYLKIFTALFISVFCVFTAEGNSNTKDYIIYMGSISNKYPDSSHHISILQKIVEYRTAEETIIRSYTRSFNGFAARLTVKEYEKLKNVKEVVSVFPSRTLQLQTTRSWDFLGLPEPTPEQIKIESDIIIGVIDSGIWPESPSFNDHGLSPVPKKWKGGCFGGKNFTCNKKVIGARGYTVTTATGKRVEDARDLQGHGSHTASTAAGRKVEGTSFYGIANGTARGGVPSARIAVYKVCDTNGCNETGVLAAFDDAIADGVDLITISVGGNPVAFYADSIAIGTFHAMAKGVLTVQSAGNEGFFSSSVGSVAPWLFTVAASSIDRRIIAKVILGNGKTFIGNSINSFKLKGDKFPLVYGKDATSSCDEDEAKACFDGCLDEKLVKGKIIVCDSITSYEPALKAGAIGSLGSSSIDNVSFILPLPAAELDDKDFKALISYINTTKAPKANILRSEIMNDTTAPIVAEFSSRGPNSIAPDILKPDISAPGVDILAAYSPKAPISEYEEDKRSVTYSMISGTSMACPHVAGAAAYVKSVHPDWSPAAIKSALMTTAEQMNPSKNKGAEFAYGSGHLNPLKATNPGLVYEATKNDYITFLCKSGYDQQKLAILAGNNSIICPKQNSSPIDVNYPSLSTKVASKKPFTVKFSRTLTNVGKSNSTYNAKVISGSKVKVTVQPNSLFFKSFKENKSFTVTVVGKGLSHQSRVSASLVWSDEIHTVRSPIVVYTH